MAVGNPFMQRMLSERRAALGLPVRDPQESDPTRQQPSNPNDYFDDILRVLYNESIYVCFTLKPLRGVYHEILRVVYDETMPCALRGIYFIVNEQVIYDETSVTTDIGYKHIGCASIYGHEKEIGSVVKKLINHGFVKLEELFITWKLCSKCFLKNITWNIK
ncbi:hypothetical protein YC2023_107894 [Brassica napus]